MNSLDIQSLSLGEIEELQHHLEMEKDRRSSDVEKISNQIVEELKIVPEQISENITVSGALQFAVTFCVDIDEDLEPYISIDKFDPTSIEISGEKMGKAYADFLREKIEDSLICDSVTKIRDVKEAFGRVKKRQKALNKIMEKAEKLWQKIDDNQLMYDVRLNVRQKIRKLFNTDDGYIEEEHCEL